MYPIDCNHYQVFMIFFLEIRQYRGFVAQSLSHFTFKTQSDQIQSQVKKSLIRVWCFPHKSEFIYLTSIDDNLYFKRTNSSFFTVCVFILQASSPIKVSWMLIERGKLFFSNEWDLAHSQCASSLFFLPGYKSGYRWKIGNFGIQERVHYYAFWNKVHRDAINSRWKSQKVTSFDVWPTSTDLTLLLLI